MKIGIGIDTGGTCTDAVAFDMDNKAVLAKAKALTTHGALHLGIGKALDGLPQEYIRMAEVVSLSTTLATNACLEDKGSRCKLVIFGLTEELVRRFKISDNYGIPLNKVLCIDTHGSADGLRVDLPDWDKLTQDHGVWLQDADVLACSELYSGQNGAPCEKAFKRLMQDKYGISAVCAAELTDELNVIARGATAMLNARLLPIINSFITAILDDLQSRNCHARVAVVRSDGSMMNAEATLNKPVETILSGPASSVLAGKAFCREGNYVTVDMGGTTTDVSVVIDGKPAPARGGIRLGSWRTTVQGIFASPFALGGDTQIWMEDEHYTVQLGTRRVKSLCSAAVQWPEIKEMLFKIVNTREKHINRFPLHEVIYMLRSPERPEMYSSSEQRLIRALESGPMLLEDMDRRAGLDLYSFSTDRLESEGIIMRCGLTPTDFMHIRGDYSEFDRETSVLGARYLLAALGREDTEEQLSLLCDQVYEAVEERLYCNLVHILLRQRYPGSFEGRLNPQTEFLVHRSWQDRNNGKNVYINQLFESGMTLVGIGAPIHLFLPEVAKALGAECVLPDHHDVANAIGTLQAKLSTTVRVEVTQMQEANGTLYYIAHLPTGAVRYEKSEPAIEAAKKAAVKKVLDEAKQRGAVGNLVPIVRAGRASAYDARKKVSVLMGAVAEAEIEQELL